MKRFEGSYTVEITLLLPLIFMAMFLPIYKAFDCYKEVKQDSGITRLFTGGTVSCVK